jgi:hypothetical protein
MRASNERKAVALHELYGNGLRSAKEQFRINGKLPSEPLQQAPNLIEETST